MGQRLTDRHDQFTVASCKIRRVVYFEFMTDSKTPTLAPSPTNWTQAERAATLSGLGCATTDAGAKFTAADAPVLIRYASTPSALLSQRDVERLRRYVLDAPDQTQQEARQQALFDAGFCVLGHRPQSSIAPSPNSSPVVNLGLFAWPVLVRYASGVHMKNVIPFKSWNAALLAEVNAAWARALGVFSADVCSMAAVSVHRLTDLSPLILQSCMSRESRRLALIARGSERDSNSSPTLLTSTEPNQWESTMVPDVVTIMEPDRPEVLLLLAYVGWDHSKPHPTCQTYDVQGSARMSDLMTAVMTYGQTQTAMAASASLSVAKAHHGAPQRTPCKPYIFLGRPQPLHDAITQGQWLQLAGMCNCAMLSSSDFHVSHVQQGDLLTWSAAILDDQGDPQTTLRYTYDGFWRPLSHVNAIYQNSDPVEGSGQMPGTGPDQALH